MQFDVISLFPEMILDGTRYGVTGKAIQNKVVGLSVWNPRDYTVDNYRRVDDRPYGGGPGMVMKYQPLADAVAAAKNQIKVKNKQVICLSPQGKPINHALLSQANEKMEQLILVAGRYEGIDERFINTVCDEEWSLGDYVLSGGELGALVIIDAMTRLIPGVLGDEKSAQQDSYSEGILDCPHYTRPEILAQGTVPHVLLSGHHAKIKQWRLKQALGRTWQRRTDLLKNKKLTTTEDKLLKKFKLEMKLGCSNE